MKYSNEDLAIAGLLHDIGKFAQRAKYEQLRSSEFNRSRYNYLHAAYSAQVMNDYFNINSSLIDISAMHHNLKDTNGDDEYWIVAAADRLASGFERETFENYNSKSDFENEDYKRQRLKSIFNEDKEYKIDFLSPESIFLCDTKSNENEYEEVWKLFLKDLEKVEMGNRHTDLTTIDFLLKKYTSFMPSSTTFKKGGFDAVKANIPLYDHLKATAIFSSSINGMSKDSKENILNYYKKQPSNPLQNDFLLIAGDFFGIQKFIFDDVDTKNAAKLLRSKSAYVQILIKIIAFSLCEKLELSIISIISDSAGKFEILAPNTEENKTKIKQFQKELNKFFIEKFFGETGVGISCVECSIADFLGCEGRDYLKLREKLALEVERCKYNKFDLLHESRYVLEMEEGLNNQNLCPHCKKRVIKNKNCEICQKFIDIGKDLVNKSYLAITKDQTGHEVFGGYFIKFIDEPKIYKNSVVVYDIRKEGDFKGFAKWELSSYVPKKDGEVMDFKEIAQKSVGNDTQKGIKALMSLKGDVDDMGIFIRKSKITSSFAKFNFFSRIIDYYFSVYVPSLMKESNIYTVFAGGDDLFIIGAWDEVIELSKIIREDFVRFCDEKLSFSVGMILTKSNKPVKFIADFCEEALEKSKQHKETDVIKNAITLFSETVSWDNYIDEDGILDGVDELIKDNTAFLYRLLEFTNMSKYIKGEIEEENKEKRDKYMESSMWKSKLSYSFYRNMDMNDKKNENFMNFMHKKIEENPKELKMYLFEFIYKRRVKQ